MSLRSLMTLACCCLLVSACDFSTQQVDEKFGKQNFVSAVSIIELHKIRNGVYPDSLDDLEFLGDWDSIWLSAVKYQKRTKGYDLYVKRGWIAEPDLLMPIKFKQGLGLQRTNVRWQKD